MSTAADTKSAPATAATAAAVPVPIRTDAQLVADLKASLAAEGIAQHLTLIEISNGVLSLAGKVPVPLGSEMNLLISELQEKYPKQIKVISRAGLSFVPRHKGTGQYELSPDDADLTEYHDDEKVLERKLSWLARKMKASRHMVAYTGAGISTAAKIPDFRGPQGVWTRRDRGQDAPSCIAMEQAVPTLAHRALVKLLETKTMKYLVSQNVDGLHRRSGIPRDSMSELHGNCYIENCNNESCKAEFLRHFDVCAHHGSYFAGIKDVASKSGISHITGRVCETCKKGILRDSIIHFGENLPEEALERATQHSVLCDLSFVIGTSLRVTPACDLPEMVKKNAGPMVVVNLQATGKDPTALGTGGVLIHAKCDHVMSVLMHKLGITDFANVSQAALDAEWAAIKAKAEADKKVRDEAEAKKQAAWAKKAADDAKAAAAADAKNAAALAAVPTHIWFGNTHAANPDPKDTNAHQWTIFVSADEKKVTSCADFIHHVDIKLHETFMPRNVTLYPSDPHGLTLTRFGWGTFAVPISIYFLASNGGARDPVHVTHTLQFADDQPLVSERVAVPPPKGQVSLLDALKSGGAGSKLKHVDTKVTTVTGESYIEKNPHTATAAAPPPAKK